MKSQIAQTARGPIEYTLLGRGPVVLVCHGTIRNFYQGSSSRQGALNDMTHCVAKAHLRSIGQPVLVIHSREDNSVPFSHAEWALSHIPQAELCEGGITGHFFWVDPEYGRICQRMVAFLQAGSPGGGCYARNNL